MVGHVEGRLTMGLRMHWSTSNCVENSRSRGHMLSYCELRIAGDMLSYCVLRIAGGICYHTVS